jgi:hypothetical protein
MIHHLFRWIRIFPCLIALFGAEGTLRGDETDSRERAVSIGDIVHRPRPRLLISPEDVERLRVRCGVDGYDSHPSVIEGLEIYGSRQQLYERMKLAVDAALAHPPERSFFPAAALVHLVSGRRGESDSYTSYVESGLQKERFTYGAEQAVIALDWCWEAIDETTRRQVAGTLLYRMRPFDDPTIVYSHARFGPRTAHLGAAITFAGADEMPGSSSQAGKIATLINQAGEFLHEHYLPYLDRSGPVPPSPESGLWETAIGSLLLEFWRTGAGEDLWPEVRGTLGRRCEPFLWWSGENAGRRHAFRRDGSGFNADRPSAKMASVIPAIPFLIANRLGDPVAQWFARRSPLLGERPDQRAIARGREWIPILYYRPETPEVDVPRAATSRSWSSGFVAMRSGWDPGDTVVLFDVGQPLLQGTQHYDAGQFQVYHKGLLAPGGGDEVGFSAVPASYGRQGIGNREWDFSVPGLGPFAQYVRDTVSHNCVLIHDARLSAAGDDFRFGMIARGQRIIDSNWPPTSNAQADSLRRTGALQAFETNEIFDYAASDLTSAYPKEILSQWIRRLLLIKPDWLLVIDQIVAAVPGQSRHWLLHLPSRPIFGGDPLPSTAQIAGVESMAGIWSIDRPERWLTVDSGGGRMHVRTLWPLESRWVINGGPSERRAIERGQYSGGSYVGGGSDTYEHWTSLQRTEGSNAWFELGDPAVLGADFGRFDRWGRLTVEHRSSEPGTTFVHLLAIGDREVVGTPQVNVERTENLLKISVADEREGRNAVLEFDAVGEFAGKLIFSKRSDESGERFLLTARPADSISMPTTRRTSPQANGDLHVGGGGGVDESHADLVEGGVE